MLRWLTPTLVCAFSLAGCLVHERPEDVADAGRALVDTSLEARDAPLLLLDVASPRDALTPLGDADVCALDETSVAVRIEPVTLDVARCMVTHADGAMLTGVDAAPADDGIRIHFDLCPTADADCRCDVIVANVGIDIAATLAPSYPVTLDVAPGEGFFPGAYVAITKVPTCECDGCGCGEPLYLYAANTAPDFAAHVPAPMTFSNGPTVCPMSDCTFGGSSLLHARGDAGESDVPGGTQRELGSIHVRAIRNVEVFSPCAACAGCGTPIGAWIAWVSGV